MSSDIDPASLEMGSTFQVIDQGAFVPSQEYAPPVFLDEAPEDISIDAPGWEAWSTGRSNQYGYSGPIMHSSEFIGGGLARDLLDEPGTYVVVEVKDLADLDTLVGWVILKRGDDR